MAMLVMVRDREYPELLESLKGKRVAVWTCDTCARLCNSIGGKKSAEALAHRLGEDGVEVSGVHSTSASCLMSKVSSKAPELLAGSPDLVLSLTCDVGAACAASTFLLETINPVETLGYGYLSDDGVPVLLSDCSGRAYPSGEKGCSPFVSQPL